VNINNTKITWESNPYAYGAIHARIEGRKSFIGGISNVGGVVKGYFISEKVYEGDNEYDAMRLVEKEIHKLPIHIILGFKD
jgi:hypothetical protein